MAAFALSVMAWSGFWRLAMGFHSTRRVVTLPKKSWIALTGMRRMRPGVRMSLPVQFTGLESVSEDAPSFDTNSYAVTAEI